MPPLNVLIFAGVVALSFFGGWTAQGWHRDSQEIDRVEANLELERLAGRARTANETRVVAAQNSAAARATAARSDAAAARSELDSVRALSDSALAAAGVSHAACVDRATAINDVFKNCAGRYSELGEAATRHANDLQTMIDAWPGKP